MSVPRRHRRLPAALAAFGLVVLACTVSPPLAASGAPSPRVTASTRMPSGNFGHWKLAFADNFTKPLNMNAWAVYTQPGGSNPTTAWFSRKHVRVAHCQLSIRGYVDRAAKSDGRVVTGGLGRWHLPQDYGHPVGGLSTWHVLGVVWTPKSIRYTIDGHYWGKPKTTHLPKGRMVLVLQTEGKVRPNKVDLPGGSCNAHVAWVVQYAYR